MIRRSPAEFYIKYLLSHPDNFSDEDVVKSVQGHQLDLPGGSYLERLRHQLVRPQPFFPYDIHHHPSYQFLNRNRIYFAFHPDEAMMDALKILALPRAKEMVETMMIIDDPPILILHRLESLGLRTDKKSLVRYAHHFWNIQLVDSTELRALLDMRFKTELPDDAGGKDVARGLSLRKAAYADPRLIAANSPSAQAASLIYSVRSGFLPTRLDVSKLISTTAELAIAQAHIEMLSGGPSAAMRARDYTTAAQNLYMLLEQRGAPDTELHRSLIGMGLELKHTEQDVSGIHQLTEGNFSAEMQVVRESIDEDADSTSGPGR